MTKPGKLFGGLIFLIGGFVLLIVVLTGGILTYQFLKYRSAGLDGLQNAPQAVVAITSPQAFSQAPEGSPLPVDVSSNGYQPLVSTELWVDGILMGVQAAPPSGQLMFPTTFLWFPGGTGEFSLVARTLDTQGNIFVSRAVLVNILPHVPAPGADGSVAFDNGPAMVLPAVASSGTNGSSDDGLPSPGDSVGAAEVGPPSPGDWLTELTNKKPPEAPALAVTIKGCTATLSIHDLSNNEEGFQVFLSTDYAPGWTEIAALNSQSAHDWITYDNLLKGASQASYYVVAVNKIGQAKSNIATASFSSTGCPTAESSQQVLSVEPLSFTTDLAVHQAYCYKSLNDSDWDRWPETGFFEPSADGFDIQKYKLAFALNGLDGKPILKTLDLRLECWGWAGSALQFLGETHFTNDVSNLREQDEQRGADIAIKLRFGKGDSRKAGNFDLPTPQSGQIPKIFAQITYDSKYCVQHLPPAAQNLVGGLIFCSKYGSYTVGPGSANPQPYLIWFVSTTFCPDGQGSTCKFLPELASIAQANNGAVEFVIDSSASKSDDTSPYGKTSYVIPPESCIGQRQFTVRISYGDENINVMGPVSNPVSVPCFVGNQVGLNVSFNTLTLSSMGDGIGGGDNLELYGALTAISSDGSTDSTIMQYYPSTGCATDDIEFLPSPGLPVPPVVLNSNGTLGCNRKGDGTYSFANDLMLCPSADFFNCSSDFPENFNNNTPHVTVGDGDHLFLQVMLMDYDSGSGDDPVCIANLNTESKSVQDWANTSGEVFNLSQGDNDNAACNVQITISAGNAVQGLGKKKIP